MSGNCACNCKMNIDGECTAQCQKYLDSHKGNREAHDTQIREEGAKAERKWVLNKITKYIDEMYPVPGPEGDYIYPSRKGRREVYDQMRGLIKSLRSHGQKQERDPE